jgi:CHAT domain-containing protein/tetratricopeptide (TPR) repeat protein
LIEPAGPTITDSSYSGASDVVLAFLSRLPGAALTFPPCRHDTHRGMRELSSPRRLFRFAPRLSGLAAAISLGLVAAAARTAPAHTQTRSGGVIVEEVGSSSVGAKAGIRPGDVVLSWTRAPAPPANPDEARGDIRSAFDLAGVEIEQAPRGEVRLAGTRDDASFTLTLPPGGAWEISVRPQLPPEWLATYHQGKSMIDAGGSDKGVAAWRELAARADSAGEAELGAWLGARVGGALANLRKWEEAHAAYQQAIALAKEHGAPAIAAQILDDDGVAFERQNDFPKAAAAYREALQLRETISQESLAVARSLNVLGNLGRLRGELSAAERFLKQSISIYEKAAPESLPFAASLNNIGLVERDRGNPAGALASLKKSLDIRERLVPDSLDVAASLNNLGLVAFDRGELTGAEAFYKRSLTLKEKLSPESLTVAATLTNLGVVAKARGNLPAAEELHRRSLAIRQKIAPGTLTEVIGLTNVGVVAKDRGDLTAAEDHQRGALALAEKLVPNSLTVASILGSLGLVATDRGDLAVAEQLHRRSLEILEKVAPNSSGVASSLSNLGSIAFERGDLAAAEQFHRRALAIKDKLAPNSLSVTANVSALGLVARNRGDLAAAKAHYDRALAITEKLAPDSLAVAAMLNNLGIVAQQGGELAAAEAFFNRSLAIKNNLAPESLPVAASYENLGDVASQRGDRVAAERFLTSALALRQKFSPGSIYEAKTLYSLGVLARDQGRREAATNYFERAIAAVEAQSGRLGGADEVRSAFSARYATFFGDYIKLLIELDQAEPAFHVLERSRARSLLTMLAERDLAVGTDLPAGVARERKLINAEYDSAQSAIAGLNPAKDAAELDRLLARLRELRDKREAVAQTIRRASPRFASLQYPQPLELTAARRSLDRGTVLLAYCVTKEKTFLFVVQPSGRPLIATAPAVSVFTVAMGETALREKVASLRRRIQLEAGSDAPSLVAFTPAATELFDALVKPASAFIAASDRVLISPDGPLHALPFSVLTQTSDRSARRGEPRYFIEWKPLHIILSATLYAELKKKRTDGVNASPSTVLAAFGDPFYPPLPPDGTDRVADPEVRAAVRGYTLSPLPASRTEVERIAHLYAGRAVTYLGDEATEERAKAVGTAVRYLHFAGHSLLDERFPLNSALALAIPARPAEGQANGLLQAWEIFEQMRIDADLVVLSACETGLGTELGGEGLIGLTRAFQYAGARAVLASLWKVEDESTAELMTRFYRHLNTGKAKDDALRAAQLEMIRMNRAGEKSRTARRFSHPFHWAAFQLIGDRK